MFVDVVVLCMEIQKKAERAEALPVVNCWTTIRYDNVAQFCVKMAATYFISNSRFGSFGIKGCKVFFSSRYTNILRWISDSPGPSGYLIVEVNGGLNQQRSAVCQSFIICRLNFLLVVLLVFCYSSIFYFFALKIRVSRLSDIFSVIFSSFTYHLCAGIYILFVWWVSCVFFLHRFAMLWHLLDF